MISKNEKLEPYRRFWVEMRPKQEQKVSLKLYRQESKKIIKILQRYCDQVEKASCDEAYLDVTSQVKLMLKKTKEDQFKDTPEAWCDSLFLGFEKGEGHYTPDTEKDKKIFLANQIAHQARKAIYDELGYHASAGISINKTVAKVASSYNKPNG